MTGQTLLTALERSPWEMSQLAYRLKAVALRGGPSRCGRPQDPVNAVRLTWNFGSPRPPDSGLPDGFEVPCSLACAETYSSILRWRDLSPWMNCSTRTLYVKAESRVQVYQSFNGCQFVFYHESESNDLQSGSVLDGLATTAPGAAPFARLPSAPILASTPLMATSASFVMKRSRLDP